MILVLLSYSLAVARSEDKRGLIGGIHHFSSDLYQEVYAISLVEDFFRSGGYSSLLTQETETLFGMIPTSDRGDALFAKLLDRMLVGGECEKAISLFESLHPNPTTPWEASLRSRVLQTRVEVQE